MSWTWGRAAHAPPAACTALGSSPSWWGHQQTCSSPPSETQPEAATSLPQGQDSYTNREKEKKKKSSLVQLALIYICKRLSDNYSKDLWWEWGVTCSAPWDVLVCVRLPSPSSSEHSKDLWEHSLPGRSSTHHSGTSCFSGCYNTNLVMLKLLCTSGLAIYAKVVQRLPWENRAAALLESYTLTGL